MSPLSTQREGDFSTPTEPRARARSRYRQTPAMRSKTDSPQGNKLLQCVPHNTGCSGFPVRPEPVACGWDRAHRWGGARGCWPPPDASIEDAISTACTPAARAHRMNSERMPDRVGPGVGVPPKIRPQHALACWPSPAQALKDLSRMETLRPRIEPDARHVEILWPRSWGALGPVNGRDRPREWGRPCGNRGMAVCVVLKRPGWVLTVSEHLERAPYCSIKAVCLPFQITI